jgi:hypothetical protein
MNPHQLIPQPDTEALSDGGTWLCDLVAAVDHLRRGIRPGLTVWDALEEALRWHLADSADTDATEPHWDDPDPLRTTMRRFLDDGTEPSAEQAQAAVRRWVLVMSAQYNDAHHWPHPTPRRSFPPPLIALVDSEVA